MSNGLRITNVLGAITLDTTTLAANVYKVISSAANETAEYLLPDLANYRYTVFPLMQEYPTVGTTPVHKTITKYPSKVVVSGGNYAAVLYVLSY